MTGRCFRGFVVVCVCVHGDAAAVSSCVGGLGVCMIGCWLVEGCGLLVARVPVLGVEG